MKARIIPFCGTALLLLAVLLIVGAPVFATSPIRSWATDMYNQPSLKPQESGNMVDWPEGSVTTSGILINSTGFEDKTASAINWNDYDQNGLRYNPDLSPTNPVSKSAESLANGKYMYQVNCAVCHGSQGQAGTKVGNMRGAVAINSNAPTYTDGFLYLKITHGNSNINLMPPLGYATTQKERWDIVNFIKNGFAD